VAGPLIVPFAVCVMVIEYVSITKFAVTEMSCWTFVSVRGFCVEPSLQSTK